MLIVDHLTKRHGDKLILDQVSLVINRGDRFGLIGPNGAGKSTLLSIMAGVEPFDEGFRTLDPGVRIGYLRQGAADLPAGTLAALVGHASDDIQLLIDAFYRVNRAVANLQDSHDESTVEAYDRSLRLFDVRGGFKAVDDLTSLLARLGIADIALTTPLSSLSGGQKTRAGLAGLLAGGADILLLDEPTNHLDIDALVWLEEFVSSYRGAVVVVSHDRAFLDSVVTSIVELDDVTRQVSSYPGSYSDYAAAKRAAEESYRESYQRQQWKINRITADIRDTAAHASHTEKRTQNDYLRGRSKKVARTAKVRERKLERLLASEEHLTKPERRWGLSLDFGFDHQSGRDVVVVQDAAFSYADHTILSGVNSHIRYGDRIAITGPNGGGKSTFLRLLSGELVPNAGTVRRGASVVVGQVSQEQTTVDPNRTVLDQVLISATLSETDARTFLHRFLFGEETVNQPARLLSYGERARLALALVVLRGANLLLLDEPLNHLDLPSRERFSESISAFGGTVVMVLHDRYAIDQLATRVMEIRDGTLREIT